MGQEIDPELPMMVFDMKQGRADLILDGQRQDIWMPIMFTHPEIKRWGVMEPGVKRDMIMIEIDEKLEAVTPEQLELRIKKDYNMMEYRQELRDAIGDKELKMGVYVQIRENNFLNWTLVVSGPTKWADLGSTEVLTHKSYSMRSRTI